MACDITLGRKEPCKKAIGGLRAILFVNYDSAIAEGATLDSNGQITALDSAITGYRYELRGTTNSFSEPVVSNADTGTVPVPQNGTVTLKRQDLVTQKELKLLSWGRPLVIFEFRAVDDNDARIYRVAGWEEGCDVNYTTQSGAAQGDLNGYEVTINATEREPAPYLDPTLIGAVGGVTVVEGT